MSNGQDSGNCKQLSSRCVSTDNFEEAWIEEAVNKLLYEAVKEFCESGSTGAWVKQNECKCMEAYDHCILK